MENQNLIIVGGSGFIGSRLCKRLSHRDDIDFRIFDKAPSFAFSEKVSLIDIRTPLLNQKVLNCTSIVNLAAEHRDDVFPLSLYHEVNVIGAENICNFAREQNIKQIIFTSSVAVYGFAPVDTDERGLIAPFNEYGKTKWAAEEVYRKWYLEDTARSLVVIRPTVVFGEQNRGNVYNLLRQIASGKFVMIGPGKNRKSMAYVENVAAFIEYSLKLGAGVHIFNYIDKPDLTMNALISRVKYLVGLSPKIRIRLPVWVGLFIGKLFDFLGGISGKKFSISAIRVQKFCSDSAYLSKVVSTGFIAPVPLLQAIDNTVKYEFLDTNSPSVVFYTE